MKIKQCKEEWRYKAEQNKAVDRRLRNARKRENQLGAASTEQHDVTRTEMQVKDLAGNR